MRARSALMPKKKQECLLRSIDLCMHIFPADNHDGIMLVVCVVSKNANIFLSIKKSLSNTVWWTDCWFWLWKAPTKAEGKISGKFWISKFFLVLLLSLHCFDGISGRWQVFAFPTKTIATRLKPCHHSEGTTTKTWTFLDSADTPKQFYLKEGGGLKTIGKILKQCWKSKMEKGVVFFQQGRNGDDTWK